MAAVELNDTSSGAATPLRFPCRRKSGRGSVRKKPSYPTKKICLAGKVGVGKTSIFQCLGAKDNVDHFSYLAEVSDVCDGSGQNACYEVMVYDPTGVDTLNITTLPGLYYKDADCVLLVYDVGDKSSMPYLGKEFKAIWDNDFCQEAKFVVVRNKVDIPEANHEVTEADAASYFGGPPFHPNMALFVKTSARHVDGINQLFKETLPKLMASVQQVCPNPKPLENQVNCCFCC